MTWFSSLTRKSASAVSFSKSIFSFFSSQVYFYTHEFLLGEDNLSKKENVQQHIEPKPTDARVVKIKQQVTENTI